MHVHGKALGIFCAVMASLFLLLNCSAPARMTGHPQVMALNSGWQYRIGDSPTEPGGRFLWLNTETDSTQWTAVHSLNDIPEAREAGSLWLRIRLPNFDCPVPGLFIGIVDEAMQIYLADTLIYQFGVFRSIRDDHFQGWRHHLIPLPCHFANEWLTLRIWSDSAVKIEAPILLGAIHEIQKDLIACDIDDIVLSFSFMFIAIALIVLFFFLGKETLLLKTALYLNVIGLFILSNSSLLLTLFNTPYIFFLSDTISMFAIPIAGYMLIEDIVLRQYRIAIRRMTQIHLVFLLVFLMILLLLGENAVALIMDLYCVVATILMVGCASVIFRSRKQIGNENRVLLAGITVFFISIAVELAFYYDTAMLSGETFHLQWLPYGALFFTSSLVWVNIYRYIDTRRRKNAVEKENLEYVIQNERLKSQMMREKLEAEKWRELDQLKSRFLANISHEFRTPLTLMLGTARQLIDENHNDVVTTRSQMQTKHGLRLLRQVNNLLDFSRLEMGKMKLKVEERDIVPLVKGIFHSFDSFARQHEINMNFVSEKASFQICYDFDKMETIVINLISNAMKFTPPGGRVEVSVLQNEHLEIRVANTGPRIPREQLSHIFDRFYQGDGLEVMHQKGSGLGLALTRELVKLHHGEIAVSSKECSGTVFTVRLPLGREHLREDVWTSEGPTSPAVPGQMERRTSDDANRLCRSPLAGPQETGRCEDIQSSLHTQGEVKGGVENEQEDENLPILLIVEDNADMRAFIGEVLGQGFCIKMAADGQEGLARAVELMPDLIISDVMMPKMDGYRLCEKLKIDERTSHIPVVLLTARSGKESKMEGLELGADDYLNKPFDSEELAVRVRNLIDQRRKLRQRFSREIMLPFKDIAVTSADEQFLERAVCILKRRLDDADMSIEWFSSEVGLSRSQLHRKLQALTGQSTSVFIRSIRLKCAVQLLKTESATITEIAYQTGFSSPEYFRACFKKQFGCSPSSYRGRG